MSRNKFTINGFIGAGILPYAYDPYKGLVFLLGLENKGTDKTRNGLYSDFGGGRDDNESPKETAFREFVEETMNAFGDDIKYSLNNPTLLYINKNSYHEYLIKIDYNKHISDTFNRIMKKMELCMTYKKYKNHKNLTIQTCPTGLVEKTEFRWFTSNEIITNKDKIRPVFYKTFVGIINTLT